MMRISEILYRPQRRQNSTPGFAARRQENECVAVLKNAQRYRRLRLFSQNSSPGTFPFAAANSTQPFGHSGRLNASTVCSGSSFASEGSVVAPRTNNESRTAILMKNPKMTSRDIDGGLR